jgi:hypothetical protein
MVDKYLIFIIIIIINFEISLEDTCQKIECSNSLSDEICVQVNGETSYFKECPSGEICEIEFDDPVLNSECKPNTKKIKRLPTLPCDSNDDCLSDHCNGNQCLGKYDGEKCNSVTDCVYGLTCRKDSNNIYRCLHPITTGNKCEYDTDCVGESGCLNNVCTKYYSLENNQKSRDLINEELSFCKSGYSNELGICLNLTLINETDECTQSNKCQYNNEFGETINIDNNCLCGYNTEGKKYCLLGSGNKNYTKYINKLKNYYLNNKNCHLSERNAEGCQKDLLSNDSYTINKIHELINAKYWAKSNNKLIGAQECSFKVEMPDYDRDLDKKTDPDIEPEPGQGKCAIYKCEESNSEYCAKSNYKNVFNIDISLYDVCSEGVECKIGGDPNEIFYNKTNINSKCFSLVENKRYPGEKCEVDTECVYPLNNPSSQFHKCEDGRCNGMDENGICEDNTWCLAGYYCDKYSGKCQEQKSKNEKCLDSKECQNDLICLESKCSDELFSLDDGKGVPKNENKEIQKKFCKSGEVLNSICVSYNDKEQKTEDNNYKKCNFGEKCIYKINGLGSDVDYEINCPCGYNSEGQGYCPHYHDYSENDWNEYKKILKNNYDNECHTENRYDCYLKKELEKEKEYKNKLERGHLFYNSVSCANKVLDGQFLFVKKFLILFGIILSLF